MTTVLTAAGPAEVSARTGGDGELWLSPEDCERLSGWTMKPQGLCRDDICVPVPATRADEFVREGSINLAAFWRRMNRPYAHSADGAVWAFGDGAEDRTDRLKTLQAPDITLPDLAGRRHALSDYRGKKVLLATWASW